MHVKPVGLPLEGCGFEGGAALHTMPAVESSTESL